MKRKKAFSTILNKKGLLDYEVLESLEAGLVLTGPETKALRLGQANLKGSFINISADGQAYLNNAQISKYQQARYDDDYDPKRARKLLLHKKEIMKLIGKAQQKQITLIPVKIYQKQGKFKVQVGIAKGKKNYQKREELKQKDIERDLQRTLKQR